MREGRKKGGGNRNGERGWGKERDRDEMSRCCEGWSYIGLGPGLGGLIAIYMTVYILCPNCIALSHVLTDKGE